jgi:hypothetical protein
MTGPAHADCPPRPSPTWVVWMSQTRDPFIDNAPLIAFTTKEDCEEQEHQYRQDAKAQGLGKIRIFKCLPDTIDPRTPRR